MNFADLHLHTSYSDSTYTPEELVVAAREAGLAAISVVDHDTVEGIPFCLDTGKKHGVEVIPGLELTSEYEAMEVHMLGYFLDYRNKNLLHRLETIRKSRVERIHKIVQKLKEMGVAIDAQKIFSLSGHGTVGRLHVARIMVLEGIIKSTREAFQKYIGENCPAYVLGFKLDAVDAIKLIKESAGVPVLAHPYSLTKQEIIPRLVEHGLMGLEVYYPEHSVSMVRKYQKICREYELLMTGGSDCHGKAKPEVRIGSLKIPYELVEKLRAAAEKL